MCTPKAKFRVVGALEPITDKSLIIMIQDYFKNILENNLIKSTVKKLFYYFNKTIDLFIISLL